MKVIRNSKYYAKGVCEDGKSINKKLLIFKTDIKTKKKIKAVKSILDNLPIISKWSLDTEDIDKVLKIEVSGNLNENDLIRLVEPGGFYCEPLPD